MANAMANYTYDATQGVTVGRVGLAVNTCNAIAALEATPAMWRGAARRAAVR